MSIKSTLFSLIDNVGLAETFNIKPHDPAKARSPLLKGIASAKKQFENGQTKAPNRWWKVSNNVVALTVKLAGDTFTINGVQTNHMPAERFPEFLDKFKSAVESGEFDEELASHGKGEAKVHIASAKKTATKTSGDKYPKHLNPAYEGLEAQQKRNLGRWWSMGRNPDQSLRSEAGDKPEATYKPA